MVHFIFVLIVYTKVCVIGYRLSKCVSSINHVMFRINSNTEKAVTNDLIEISTSKCE